MRILLDTHVLIWALAQPDRLSDTYLRVSATLVSETRTRLDFEAPKHPRGVLESPIVDSRRPARSERFGERSIFRVSADRLNSKCLPRVAYKIDPVSPLPSKNGRSSGIGGDPCASSAA
jgi:hypothetical protein